MKNAFGLLKSIGSWKVRSLFGPNMLDYYTNDAPSAQKAIDIFKGEWASKIPGYESGIHTLFDDERIHWFEKISGGYEGKKILELGPLEAGHSYMLQKKGAKSILAVEGNSRAYLKCLLVKELLQLNKLSILFGEIVSFLEVEQERYDIIMALGVLYHMTRPVEAIKHICRSADKVCLWSHYYDAEAIAQSALSHKFGKSVVQKIDGFTCEVTTCQYQSALVSKHFCGGFNPYSYWMPKRAIIDAFHHFGMKSHAIEFDQPGHENGPAFCVFFSKEARM